MLNPEISLVNLFLTLDSKFGKGKWADLEPETIQLELEEASPLLSEKIYALKALANGFSTVLEMPEFVLWLTSVANNEFADFEHINHPTSLELAWMVKQVQLLSVLLQLDYEPSEAIKAICAYFLKEDGFSKPLEPFSFVDEAALEPGQSEEDTLAKKTALDWYLVKMKELSHA